MDRRLGFLTVVLALMGVLGMACSTTSIPASRGDATPNRAPGDPSLIQRSPTAVATATSPVKATSTPESKAAAAPTPAPDALTQASNSEAAPAPTPEPDVPTQASQPEAAPAPEATASGAKATVDRESYGSIFKRLNPDGPKEVDARFYRQLLPPDAIKPIYDPEIIAAKSARLEDDDLIIGLTVGAQARAYPIRTLRFREMVNDELDGVPILVTW